MHCFSPCIVYVLIVLGWHYVEKCNLNIKWRRQSTCLFIVFFIYLIIRFEVKNISIFLTNQNFSENLFDLLSDSGYLKKIWISFWHPSFIYLSVGAIQVWEFIISPIILTLFLSSVVAWGISYNTYAILVFGRCIGYLLILTLYLSSVAS